MRQVRATRGRLRGGRARAGQRLGAAPQARAWSPPRRGSRASCVTPRDVGRASTRAAAVQREMQKGAWAARRAEQEVAPGQEQPAAAARAGQRYPSSAQLCQPAGHTAAASALETGRCRPRTSGRTYT